MAFDDNINDLLEEIQDTLVGVVNNASSSMSGLLALISLLLIIIVALGAIALFHFW